MYAPSNDANTDTTTQLSDDERTILEMLTYCRPHKSATERAFIKKYLAPLGVSSDAAGNRILKIGEKPTILFSSHTDTVHHDGGTQRVIYGGGVASLDLAAAQKIERKRAKAKPDAKAPQAKLKPKAGTKTPIGSSKVGAKTGTSLDDAPSCLGGDDTGGVWLMIELAKAGVPGLYIWHRGEECGGIGSNHIADVTPELLDGIKMAIAFDRKGYSDVITHQGGARCCSDEFAESLCKELRDLFQPSKHGIFTDTANYTSLVPECTNLSIGYFKQHTFAEYQDVKFLISLRDLLLKVDWNNLVVNRDPSKHEYDDWSSAYYGAKGSYSRRSDKLYELVFDNPEAVTELLRDIGYDADSLDHYIKREYGTGSVGSTHATTEFAAEIDQAWNNYLSNANDEDQG